jgi:hypothetical protein
MLEHDVRLLSACVALLQLQMATLAESRQWQPQLQLLQQQGGGVLLQGLAMAAQCAKLDVQLQQDATLRPMNLLHALAIEPEVTCVCVALFS